MDLSEFCSSVCALGFSLSVTVDLVANLLVALVALPIAPVIVDPMGVGYPFTLGDM